MATVELKAPANRNALKKRISKELDRREIRHVFIAYNVPYNQEIFIMPYLELLLLQVTRIKVYYLNP